MQYVSESFPSAPLVTSAALAWPGVRSEQCWLEAGELAAHYHTHHLLMLYQADLPLMVRRQYDGKRAQMSVYQTRDLERYSGNEYGAFTWATPNDNPYLMVDD